MNAAGYIYLNDGISTEADSPKFEFLVTLGDESGDLTIKQTNPGQRRNVKEEEIGVVKIFWASHFKLDIVQFNAFAHIYDKDGKKKTLALDAVVYDANADVLVIPATYKQDDKTVNLSFFDFGAHGYIRIERQPTPATA